MLSHLAGKMSAIKRGVISNTNVAEATHTLSVLTAKAGIVTAVKCLVVTEAGIAAAARAKLVIRVMVCANGMSALTVMMLTGAKVTRAEGTLFVISLLASIVTARKSCVIAYIKVFAAYVTVVNNRLSAG